MKLIIKFFVFLRYGKSVFHVLLEDRKLERDYRYYLSHSNSNILLSEDYKSIISSATISYVGRELYVYLPFQIKEDDVVMTMRYVGCFAMDGKFLREDFVLDYQEYED